VPNKTIYVSDGDLPLYQRAQELAGGNLSAAISTALRRYVDVEEGRGEGFDEIVVRVGPGPWRKVRFSGVLLAEWLDSASSRVDVLRVYRSRTGKYVLHTERSGEYRATDAEGRPAGWRGFLGVGNVRYASRPASASLEVVETLEELRDKVPPELFEMVAQDRPQAVEDLDI
jgi:EXLDI family protein